jgi:hypothetical protein
MHPLSKVVNRLIGRIVTEPNRTGGPCQSRRADRAAGASGSGLPVNMSSWVQAGPRPWPRPPFATSTLNRKNASYRNSLSILKNCRSRSTRNIPQFNEKSVEAWGGSADAHSA